MHHVLVPLLTLLAAGIGAILVTGLRRFNPIRALAVGPHLVSHQLCSATFVAGLESDAYHREVIAPSLGALKGLAQYRVDRNKREVIVTLAGRFRSRAVFRGAEGCLVVPGAVRKPSMAPPVVPEILPPIAGRDCTARSSERCRGPSCSVNTP